MSKRERKLVQRKEKEDEIERDKELEMCVKGQKNRQRQIMS